MRTLVVVDDPSSDRQLRTLLGPNSDIEVLASVRDARTAMELAKELCPDLILLDIPASGPSGLDVLPDLAEMAPAVVFVAARAEFAINAFDLAATDYVLKPIEPARLELAIARARKVIAARNNVERIQELEHTLAQLQPADDGTGRLRWERAIWIAHRGERMRIPVEEISLVRAERDYVRLHTGHVSYLLRQPLETLERRLNPTLFARIHRSVLVRIDRVRRIRREKGRLFVSLDFGAEAPVSRRYAARIRALVQAGERNKVDPP